MVLGRKIFTILMILLLLVLFYLDTIESKTNSNCEQSKKTTIYIESGIVKAKCNTKSGVVIKSCEYVMSIKINKNKKTFECLKGERI